MAETEGKPRLRESIAGEIRVAMVRRGVTGAALAEALNKSQAYVSRRLSGNTAFDVDDLETIAETLQVEVSDLIGHAERGDGAYLRKRRLSDAVRVGVPTTIPRQTPRRSPLASTYPSGGRPPRHGGSTRPGGLKTYPTGR